MSGHSQLERSADALFQQKALQTSHHERLAAEVQTSMRSIRHSYQQTRDAVADVKRLQEDLRDVQEETTQLETALRSQHQLRLSMLSALCTKAMEEAAGTTDLLENAPLRWTGIPARIVKLSGDLDEYETFDSCLSETRDAVLTAQSTAAAAARVHALAALVTDLTRINATLHQALVPAIAQAEGAVGDAVVSLAADHDVLRRDAAYLEQQSHADATAQQALQADTVTLASQAVALDAALASLTVTEGQLHDAQAAADHQLQSLRDASTVHMNLLQPLLEAYAAEMVLLTKASSAAILPDAASRRDALHAAREALHVQQSQLQAKSESLSCYALESSALGQRQQELSAVLSVSVCEWNAMVERATALRAAKETLTAERARLAFANARLTQEMDAIQAHRIAQLAAVQAAMTRLIMDAMPQGREAIVSLEDVARQALFEAQLQDLSCAIDRSAARQHHEEAAAAAAAVTAQRRAMTASQRHHANATSNISNVPEVASRPTVAHRPQPTTTAGGARGTQHASQALQVIASQPTAATPPGGVPPKAVLAPTRRPLLRRALPRGASPAMSAWSADGHAMPQPQGEAMVPPPKTSMMSVSGNGGAAKGPVAMETPSPLPRVPQRRTLAPASSAFAKASNTHGATSSTTKAPHYSQHQQQHSQQLQPQSSLAAALRRPTKNSLFDLSRGTKPTPTNKSNEVAATDAAGGDEFDVFAL